MTRARTAPVLFGLLLAAQLVPVWAFPYLPTHDGPSHLLNATVFRDLGDPASPARAFYERRLAPIPNWTEQALLLGLLRVLSPPAAAKLIASLYAIGLPLALFLLLRAVGSEPFAAILALPLVFNRCFFLGFTNYCLSLVVVLLALALFLRSPDEPGVARSLQISALLTLAYFTHLAGFLLAAAALLALALALPGPRLQRLARLVAALAPGLLLAGWYAGASGLASSASGAALRTWRPPLGDAARRIASAPAALDREIFGVYAGRWPIGLLVLGAAVFWAVWSQRTGCTAARAEAQVARRFLVASAAAVFLALPFVPDHLGAQGGFLRTRLAVLAAVLAVAAFPRLDRARRAVPAVVASLVVVLDLGLVLRYETGANRELAAFTAARALVGAGETLVTTPRAPGPEPLAEFRVAEYYCLAARALCLTNYEPWTGHFPVRLRPGVKERLRENRPGSFWADVVLSWGDDEAARPLPSEPYRAVYERDGLRIFRREPPQNQDGRQIPR